MGFSMFYGCFDAGRKIHIKWKLVCLLDLEVCADFDDKFYCYVSWTEDS